MRPHARRQLPAGVGLQRLGRFRVRDFDEPPELYRVDADGLQRREIAPRVRPAEGHNLVRPATSFEGREADLEALILRTTPGRPRRRSSAPAAPARRGWRPRPRWPSPPDWEDGAWFVDLAPVSAHEVVPEAIAQAVGAKSVPGDRPLGRGPRAPA